MATTAWVLNTEQPLYDLGISQGGFPISFLEIAHSKNSKFLLQIPAAGEWTS